MVAVESFYPVSMEEARERVVNDEHLRKDLTMCVSPVDQEKCPWRNPDALQAAWEEQGTVTGCAEVLDCNESTARRWLAVYGYRSKSEGRGGSYLLENMTPGEAGLSPMQSDAQGGAD